MPISFDVRTAKIDIYTLQTFLYSLFMHQIQNPKLEDQYETTVAYLIWCYYTRNAWILTITSRFFIFWGKINPPPHSTTRVWHDAQTTFQNGRHHSHVSAMPQQLPVLQSITGAKARSLQREGEKKKRKKSTQISTDTHAYTVINRLHCKVNWNEDFTTVWVSYVSRDYYRHTLYGRHKR